MYGGDTLGVWVLAVIYRVFNNNCQQLKVWLQILSWTILSALSILYQWLFKFIVLSTNNVLTLFIAALPKKLPTEGDKDKNNQKVGISTDTEYRDVIKCNSASDSSKTTTTSFIEESHKLKIEQNNSSTKVVDKQVTTKDCQNGNEKGTCCIEKRNNNTNGFNNSFHERVLVNNTNLVTL